MEPESIYNPDGTLKSPFRAYAMMINAGQSSGEAAVAIGYNRNFIKQNEEEILTSWAEDLDAKATKVIENTLEGRATGDTEVPKVSDCLSAAKMVKDRTSPVVNHHKIDKRSMSLSMDVTPERMKEIDAALKEHYSGIPTEVIEHE